MSCDEYKKEFLPDLSYLIARCYCSSGRLRMELDEVCRLAARSEAGCARAQVQCESLQPMRWSTLDGEHLLYYVGIIEYRISINEQHKCYPLQHYGKQKNGKK